MSGSRRWRRDELAIKAERLAPALLGSSLVRVLEDGTRLAGRIVEVEAYLGVKDRAAHSFGGRRTPRVEPMYGAAGTFYVYFTYGMHHCCNVVCGAVDEPVAVLVRALEPVDGLAAMRRFTKEAVKERARGTRAELEDHRLCAGPGRLCRALSIGRGLSGLDLVSDARVWLERGGLGDGGLRDGERVARGARIGIDSAGEWAGKPLRWWVEGNASVSVQQRSRAVPKTSSKS